MDPDKVREFLAEYRDLVHRHGMGLGWDDGSSSSGLVVEVLDPDAHVALIADERPSETKKTASRR